jgi:hypothetical protein
MSRNALNLLVIHFSFIQTSAEPAADGVPTKPRTVNALRDTPPGEIVQVESVKQFFASKNPVTASWRKTFFVFS